MDDREEERPSGARPAADTLGTDGIYFDPLWRVLLELSPLEQELLESWWVRRLAFIAHAGASAITTTQSYSRLEHSLGVLVLVAHFAPEDQPARATALLHDVGHSRSVTRWRTSQGWTTMRSDENASGRSNRYLPRHGLSAGQIIGLDEDASPRASVAHRVG